VELIETSPMWAYEQPIKLPVFSKFFKLLSPQTYIYIYIYIKKILMIKYVYCHSLTTTLTLLKIEDLKKNKVDLKKNETFLDSS
jgi:hypothetical protein